MAQIFDATIFDEAIFEYTAGWPTPTSIAERVSYCESDLGWSGTPQEHVSGSQTLWIDDYLGQVLNALDEPIGLAFMVRLLVSGVDQNVDPKRIIINPPTIPRANIATMTVAPKDAIVEALFDSVTRVPN